jgi:hypothetical protein
MSRGSLVGIAAGYELESRLSSSHGKVKNTYFSASSTATLGLIQPPIQYPGIKRQGREADHSPTSAEVNKTWIYTSTPPCGFMT